MTTPDTVQVQIPALPDDVSEGDVLGRIVLIRDDGRRGWHADWDGEVHITAGAAATALAEAQAAGYEAVLTALVAGLPVHPDGEGVNR